MTLGTPALEQTLGKLLGRAVAARLAADGRPFVIAHFVTHHCPCECASCLWKHNDWRDVPLAELVRFYDQAREQGFVAAAFTGGEPFLRRDLGALAAHVKDQAGMAILCFTTGMYLAERGAEVLPHLDMLSVSIDSADPARHDAIRGVPGLFERAVAGVRAVRRDYPGLHVQLNCCVQKGIAPEIAPLVALAAELDAPISFDVITEARNGDSGGAFTSTDMGMPPDELAAVCRELRERKRAGEPIVNSERYFDYFAAGQAGYTCHFPKLAMSVDGRGNVEDCLDLTRPIANIREMPLADIMALPRFRALRADAERCHSCSSPTMVDLSMVWENPALALASGGLQLGRAPAGERLVQLRNCN
ncbi:MAG: radical SAM protein [Polyangiaceae bacterium]|nr:radical SAM protein [Polyangiaceae bacterium]